MMGQGSGGHRRLFYSFNLDDHIPADHLLRGIDRCLDLGDLRRHLMPFYSHTGRPSIDPELMVRMLIVDVEATPTLRTAEVKATRTMIERVEARFDLKPERLIGDMAYGNAELLGWMVNDKGIEPHVPLWDRTQRDDGTLSSSDFEWDEQANEYRCPQGQPLRSEWRIFKRPRTRITKANTIIYHASQ